MTQLAALLLLVLGLLPLANWIPGGHDAPWYAERMQLWLSGGAIVAGVMLLVGITVRRHPAWWRVGAWTRLAARWRGGHRRSDALLAVLATSLYAAVSQLVLSAKPLLIDEIIQLYQARIFASGRLWAAAADHPEFTSSMHLLDWGGKVYGQFPAGGPAMLAIGTLLHAEWLVGPVAGGIGVYLFARLLRLVEPRDGVALAALLLLAFAPFAVFLDASMMNHVTTTTWLLAAALALVHATGISAPAPAPAPASASVARCATGPSAESGVGVSDGTTIAVAQRATATVVRRAAVTYGLLTGFCLGMAATIRPLDALSFALPAAAWLLWRAVRGGRTDLVALLASGVGVAVPIAALFWVNHAQTGHATEFGYIAMWGKTHELGFHAAPWGFPHTPARGLELVNLYLLRLQSYFLETPVPSLLFATGALALARRVSGFDRWVLWGCLLLLLSYFAYWHDGFYLGPRFMLPLAPWLALWTARFPAELAAREVPIPLHRAVVAGGVVSLVMGATMLLPIRAEQYRHGMLSMRFDVDALAEGAGVRHALVFARESWGAQLLVRMWALGTTRVGAEQLYRTTDACRLEQALGEVERAGGDSLMLVQWLAPYRADSLRLVSLRGASDTTARILPGSSLVPICLRRIQEDRAGFTLYSPLLLAGSGGNVYVRDLHAADSIAINAHAGRELYLLTKRDELGSTLRFTPIRLDSARAEWALPPSGGAP
ncbi:MAG: hypothetical protein ABJC19_07210 [Gemmatimonadota bacterium]